MKKIITVAIILLLSLPAYSQHHMEFFYKKNNKWVKKSTAIGYSKDISYIGVFVLVQKRRLKPFHRIRAILKRKGASSFYWKVDQDILLAEADQSKQHPGSIKFTITIANFKSKNTKGSFYNNQYQQYADGNYIFSRKGQNYSNFKPVKKYTLSVSLVGAKKIGTRTRNGVTLPVYGRERYIIDPVEVTVYTTDEVPPMPKSYMVRDVEELKNLR